MKRFFLLFLVFCWGLRPMLGQNIGVHDPSVAKQGKRYYLFSTGNGIAVYSSDNLKDWKEEAPVFAQKPKWTDEIVPDFGNHIWAPDIFYRDGTYYLYYSVSAFAKNISAIGLATNSTLNPRDKDYSWEDQGLVLQSVPNRDMWNAIDPNLIEDDQGTVWMTFGSFWGGIKLVKMVDDLKGVAEPEKWYTIAKRERSFNVEDDHPGDAAIEAPFIFKKNGFYYLFVSWDYCCQGKDSSYKIVVGRSKEVFGPYLDKEGKKLTQGGGTEVARGDRQWYGVGHNSAYTFEGKDYLFYHGYSTEENGKPKLVISRLLWDDNHWPILGPAYH